MITGCNVIMVCCGFVMWIGFGSVIKRIEFCNGKDRKDYRDD
jgi:hypothetical protein